MQPNQSLNANPSSRQIYIDLSNVPRAGPPIPVHVLNDITVSSNEISHYYPELTPSVQDEFSVARDSPTDDIFNPTNISNPCIQDTDSLEIYAPYHQDTASVPPLPQIQTDLLEPSLKIPSTDIVFDDHLQQKSQDASAQLQRQQSFENVNAVSPTSHDSNIVILDTSSL